MRFHYNSLIIVLFTSITLCHSTLSKEKHLENVISVKSEDSNKNFLEADYALINPKKRDIKNILSLNGYFEDTEALEYSIKTDFWGELKVLHPPVHGKIVRKGETLIKLDLDKIQKKLRDLKYELVIHDLNVKILNADLDKEKKLLEIELKKIKRNEKFNLDNFLFYQKEDLPHEKKSAIQNFKRYEESLSYAKEELNQLKKMYEEDDLTEETEEIIITRTQNDVDRLEFALEGARILKNKRLKLEIPKSEYDKKDSFEIKNLSLNADRITKPTEIKKKRLEIEKIEKEKILIKENIEKLEKDLSKLKAVSPISGRLFAGTFSSGKWTGTKLLEQKLKPGGVLKPYEEFLTICPGKKVHARIKIPEKNLGEISNLREGLIFPGTNSEMKLNATINNVSEFPTSPEFYEAIVKVEFPQDQSLPLAGTSCTLKVITYEKKNALTLPQSSVFNEENDPDKKFIYILNSKHKPVKKIVRTGKSYGSSVEILDGIRMSTKVLKDNPTL